MKRLTSFLVVMAVLVLGAPGLLQAQDKKKKKKKDNVTVFDFEEDEVTVSFLKPDVGFVGLIQQEKMSSLIKIRQDFVDEIVRSAEDL